MLQFLFMVLACAFAGHGAKFERLVVERARAEFDLSVPPRGRRVFHSEFTVRARELAAPLVWEHVAAWVKENDPAIDPATFVLERRNAWDTIIQKVDKKMADQAVRTIIRVTPIADGSAFVEIDRVGFRPDGGEPIVPRTMRPGVVERLLEDPRLQLWAGKMPLVASAVVADKRTVTQLLQMIRDPERRQPLVFVSSEVKSGVPLVNPAELARRVRGYATVVTEAGPNEFAVSRGLSLALKLSFDGRIQNFGEGESLYTSKPWLSGDELVRISRAVGDVLRLIRQDLLARPSCKELMTE